MLFVFMYYCYLMLFHFSQYILKTSFSVHFLSLFFFSSLSLFTTVLLYLYFNYKMICFVEYIFVLFHFNLVILISLPLIWLTNTNREKFEFLFFSTLFDVIIQRFQAYKIFYLIYLFDDVYLFSLHCIFSVVT